MSFNVSRFLVSVRQFWTRKRLVPVLGVTALFLFGLTSYQYLSSFWGDDPIVARHIVINGTAFQALEAEDLEERHSRFWQFDHEKHHQRWHHEHDHESRRVAWEHARDQQRRALKLHRELKERHQLEIKNRVLEFKFEERSSEDDEEEKVIILKGEGEETFEITINGEKIEINKEKEI